MPLACIKRLQTALSTRIGRGALLAALVALLAVAAQPPLDRLAGIALDPQGFVDRFGADQTVLLLAHTALVVVLLWLAAVLWVADRRLGGRGGAITERLDHLLTPSRLRPLIAAMVGTGALALAGCATPTPAGTLPPAAQEAVESVTSGPQQQEDPSGNAAPSQTAPAPTEAAPAEPGTEDGGQSEPAGAPSPADQPGADQPGADQPEADQSAFDWPAAAPTPPPSAEPASVGTATSVGPLASAEAPTYVVGYGDCLWEIVSTRLGGASTADLAEAVHELWLANEAVIGADPDLLIPGQTLLLPAALTGSPS